MRVAARAVRSAPGQTSRSPEPEDAALDAVELALLVARSQGVCDEMGAILRRTATSPNIKDRLDFSCALFDPSGALFAQAAHIPVHLGSMAYAMTDLVARFDWHPGDVVMLNDPFLGGTHLPDVTVVVPAFDTAGELLGFAADRAHHADIGADVPGSMPLSTRIEEEGVLIPPMRLQTAAGITDDALRVFARLLGEPGAPQTAARQPDAWQRAPRLADFAAQLSAARAGAEGLVALARDFPSSAAFREAVAALDAWAFRSAQQALAELPVGRFEADDELEGDGAAIELHVAIDVCRDADGATEVHVDFAGSSPQLPSNLNCPLPVTAAAVLYAFRGLMAAGTPAVAGAFRSIRITAPEGSLLNARRPAAVAAGNVETSMRIVDLVLRALALALPERIPAAAQGSMNNVAMGARGARRWDYYETLAGGHGAHAGGPGLSARHAHMTNTLNTPVESLEAHYPLRVERYALRRGSGGRGRHHGGDGVERSYRFLEDAEVTLIGERRRRGPWGLAGGDAGAPGEHELNGIAVAGRAQLSVEAGDLLTIRTPGGGGWGPADDST
ncbi:MAG: hydantoinase B/oxoprolinase family protein [Pseudomonadales bacterium]|jgi:N-methylhydantoinase B|nr:hydantoinase B/oxoprolinase family protein [Pseudomonadales bacterium]